MKVKYYEYDELSELEKEDAKHNLVAFYKHLIQLVQNKELPAHVIVQFIAQNDILNVIAEKFIYDENGKVLQPLEGLNSEEIQSKMVNRNQNEVIVNNPRNMN